MKRVDFHRLKEAEEAIKVQERLDKLNKRGLMSSEDTANMFNKKIDGLLSTIDRLLNILK